MSWQNFSSYWPRNPQVPPQQYTQPPPPPQQPAPLPIGRSFQSIEDFMREQEQLDAVKAAQMKARAATALASTQVPKKFKRQPPVDAEAVAAEARALAEIGDTNWTGRLGEYRAAHPTAVKGLEYEEINAGKFRCIVKIHESPLIPFGENSPGFTKKKDAKQFASKKAIDWLIVSGFMPPDGSVKWPKVTPLPGAKIIGPKIPSAISSGGIAATTATASGPQPPKTTSTFASQIPELCHRLGFKMPTYKIERMSPEAPIYQGYAHFPNEPQLEGKIGEVANIFGQKGAKESIATELHRFLKDIERQRIELSNIGAVKVEGIVKQEEENTKNEDEPHKRKRSTSIGEESATKSVKLEAED